LLPRECAWGCEWRRPSTARSDAAGRGRLSAIACRTPCSRFDRRLALSPQASASRRHTRWARQARRKIEGKNSRYLRQIEIKHIGAATGRPRASLPARQPIDLQQHARVGGDGPRIKAKTRKFLSKSNKSQGLPKKGVRWGNGRSHRSGSHNRPTKLRPAITSSAKGHPDYSVCKDNHQEVPVGPFYSRLAPAHSESHLAVRGAFPGMRCSSSAS